VKRKIRHKPRSLIYWTLSGEHERGTKIMWLQGINEEIEGIQRGQE
jgi:hypothetical protein